MARKGYQWEPTTLPARVRHDGDDPAAPPRERNVPVRRSGAGRTTAIVVACLAGAVVLAVVARFAVIGIGFLLMGLSRPPDLSTAGNIDPLATAAGLTFTFEHHDRGGFDTAASWSKDYSAPAGVPACVAVLNAATRLGYTVSESLGVTADNCVDRGEQQGQFGVGSTIVGAPDGASIFVLWTSEPATVTLRIDGTE